VAVALDDDELLRVDLPYGSGGWGGKTETITVAWGTRGAILYNICVCHSIR